MPVSFLCQLIIVGSFFVGGQPQLLAFSCTALTQSFQSCASQPELDVACAGEG